MSEEKIEKEINRSVLSSHYQLKPILSGCIQGLSEYSGASQHHTYNTILVIIKQPNKDR